tara:strand:- start:94 stop:1248 length:1155 start_codon:yes stop_codon:yes gene_type:complete
MNIYYWCPFLSNVATVQAVLNSAISIKKYSKNSISPHIINAVGEWNQLKDQIIKKDINLINFTKSETLYDSLPRFSYLKSRFSYLVIFVSTFMKLYFFLKNRNQQDIFIIHLISSLPLMLILFFNFKCKFVLRISGRPKLNFFRKLLWKLCKNKISVVMCPTIETKKNLISQNIFNPNSCHTLYDPVLELKNFNLMKKKDILKNLENKKFIVNIGRLTRQKNQTFLINGFNRILKLYPELNLVILGEGELENKLKKIAKNLKIDHKVFFLGYDSNVYKYLTKAKFFILTSKWEDPGFVLLEAAISRVPIISANCPNGPNEILSNNEAGYLYNSDDLDSFVNSFKKAKNDKYEIIKNKKLKALKNSKNYTIFRHYLCLNKILKNI